MMTMAEVEVASLTLSVTRVTSIVTVIHVINVRETAITTPNAEETFDAF